MKKVILYFVFIVFTTTIINAQNQTPSGNPLIHIPGDGVTEVIMDLGNQTSGIWGIEFWMYVPTGKEAYFNLQGYVPITNGEWIVGNIFFNQDLVNPGIGFIDWGDHDPANDTIFYFPHDQWFQVVINVDISMGISEATWEFGVDGVVAVPAGTPFTDIYGSPVTSLGGIVFFSISTNTEFWVDDFLFQDSFINIGIDEIEAKGFVAFPNPVNDVLTMRADENITSVTVYNMLGQEVYYREIGAISHTINTSNFANGTYIVEVVIDSTVGSIKVVK